MFVDTPLEVCEERDAKGLYKKARAGIIRGKQLTCTVLAESQEVHRVLPSISRSLLSSVKIHTMLEECMTMYCVRSSKTLPCSVN